MTHSSPAALPNFWATTGFKATCLRLVEDERGQDLIEYALIAATVGLGTVAGVNGIASSISQYMRVVGNGFNAALASQS